MSVSPAVVTCLSQFRGSVRRRRRHCGCLRRASMTIGPPFACHVRLDPSLFPGALCAVRARSDRRAWPATGRHHTGTVAPTRGVRSKVPTAVLDTLDVSRWTGVLEARGATIVRLGEPLVPAQALSQMKNPRNQWRFRLSRNVNPSDTDKPGGAIRKPDSNCQRELRGDERDQAANLPVANQALRSDAKHLVPE
jgi:hypothetical protein